MISAAELDIVDKPKKNGRPSGKSTKWADISSRQASSRPRSRSPPPLLGLAVPAPRLATTAPRSRSISPVPSIGRAILPVPSIGRADRSRNASHAASKKKRAASTQPRRPTPSPTPGDHPVATHPIVSPEPKRTRPSTLSRCSGLYDGYFGAALFFVGRSMLHTGRRLLDWARESDVGISSFKSSALAKSSDLLLPFWDMTVRKSAEGFSIHSSNCNGDSTSRRCGSCAADSRRSRKHISKLFHPEVAPIGAFTRIDYIANNLEKAKMEIIALRERERKLK